MDARSMDLTRFKRRTLSAMKGRFLPLTLMAGLALLTRMTVTSLAARSGWVIALALIVRLIHPLLNYSQKLCFTRCLRGQALDIAAALRSAAGMAPKLLGIFALRDAPPLMLILAGSARRLADPMNLSGQALQAAGLLLGAVLAFSYCMAEYLLIDRPRLSPVGALRGSRRRLSSRRFGLFMLLLSFSGWALLAALILSIIYAILYTASAPLLVALGYLLILPLAAYADMAVVAFFESIDRRGPGRAAPARERL